MRRITLQQYRWLMEGLKVDQPKAEKPSVWEAYLDFDLEEGSDGVDEIDLLIFYCPVRYEK